MACTVYTWISRQIGSLLIWNIHQAVLRASENAWNGHSFTHLLIVSKICPGSSLNFFEEARPCLWFFYYNLPTLSYRPSLIKDNECTHFWRNPGQKPWVGKVSMYRDQVIYWGNGSVLDVICFEICTPEGRGGEKGGIANFKTKHTEPLTQEITPHSIKKYCTFPASRPWGNQMDITTE